MRRALAGLAVVLLCSPALAASRYDELRHVVNRNTGFALPLVREHPGPHAEALGQGILGCARK